MIGPLLITEFSPTPPAGEPEWVECVNVAAARIDLSGWRVCDERTCVEIPAVSVPRGAIVVLTRDAEALRESRWVPSTAIVVECALPSLNNTTDRLVLLDGAGAIVDSTGYDVRRHVKGRSIERMGNETTSGVVYTNTWAASRDRDSATCGRLNSVLTRERDLHVATVEARHDVLSIPIANYGRTPSGGERLTIRVDDTTLVRVVPDLLPGMVWTATVPVMDLPPRAGVSYRYVEAVMNVQDDRPENDTASAWLVFPPPAGGITINEIMAEPADGGNDWVEIVNQTSDTVDLAGWLVDDADGNAVIITAPARCPPGAFFVASADTTIAVDVERHGWAPTRPMLRINASDDLVVLRTPSGLVADSVPVSSRWHHPRVPDSRGTSLEKRDPALSGTNPASWTSSADVSGSTPGRANSVVRTAEEGGDMSAMPSPFSSNPARYPSGTVITWRLPFLQAIARVTVLAPDGRHVRDLADGLFVGSVGGVAWDGKDAVGQRVPRGPYVVVLECVNASSHATYQDRCLVVVGE